MRIFAVVAVFFLGLCSAFAQMMAPGDWEPLTSLSATKQVTVAGSKVFFMAESGIFYYDRADNQLVSMTKNEGLSELKFAAIDYNEMTQKLVIAYANSNIDIIDSKGGIMQISDIKRKNINGDKTIYSLYNYNQYCYICCGFGIVVLDLNKMEIRDTYIIGENGAYLPVYSVTMASKYIYASTKDGIKASINWANLLDYSNWELISDPVLENYKYDYIRYGMGRVWAAHTSDTWFESRTFSAREDFSWSRSFPTMEDIYFFDIVGDSIYYTSRNGIFIFDNENPEPLLSIETYPFAQEDVKIKPMWLCPEKDGTIWIADENYGAISYKDGNFQRYPFDGPISNSIFSMTYQDETLWTCNGGRSSVWAGVYYTPVIQKLNDEQWTCYSSQNVSELDALKDIVQILPVPNEPDHFYAASCGYGIIEMKDGQMVNHFTDKNSSLESYLASDGYIRVGGMAFDSEGNLWASNSLVEKKLHKLDPSGKWTSYELSDLSGNLNVGELLITKNQNIWMQVPRNNGLFVMSTDGSKKRRITVTSLFSNGTVSSTTTMNDIYSMVEDAQGQIWIGTSNGIAVYSNPSKIFETSPLYSSQPAVDMNDGKFHPLLQNQTVTAIAVDGGNQKWCGTKSSGLFLVSDDGTEQLEHFTTDNSLLISNNITSLAYDGTTGILYVGTDLGLMRYKTKTVEGKTGFDQVYAYPNPVRETYKGDIYITGLMTESNVKITDLNGRLVYETTSEGGQATWPGTDLSGRRVNTGIYLVFCASSDGKESAVTKILFIR